MHFSCERILCIPNNYNVNWKMQIITWWNSKCRELIKLANSFIYFYISSNKMFDPLWTQTAVEFNRVSFFFFFSFILYIPQLLVSFNYDSVVRLFQRGLINARRDHRRCWRDIFLDVAGKTPSLFTSTTMRWTDEGGGGVWHARWQVPSGKILVQHQHAKWSKWTIVVTKKKKNT